MGITAIIVAAAALAGYVVTTLLLRSLGYPGDPADGPAITGAAIYGLAALALVQLVRRLRSRSS
ncbi:MAG TPA: hypothetical protein VMQ65_04525 [Candidatus Limnocylindria bacterium]|nr:hypothetical protein [Candidatus Limnocylindria bacterium]